MVGIVGVVVPIRISRAGIEHLCGCLRPLHSGQQRGAERPLCRCLCPSGAAAGYQDPLSGQADAPPAQDSDDRAKQLRACRALFEALRNYRIGAIDVAELRELLDNAAIRYELLPKAGQGIAMLQAGRFDLLISDVLPELVSAPVQGKPVQRVMVLARVERWLACHPQLPPSTVKRLRAALTLGVFDDAMADIWQRYGLSSVYNGVRREWILIP